MADIPVVAVIGATGQQGGGVVDALMSKTRAKVRALTRNASSPKAKALTPGLDVVRADLGDRASLVKALQGVDSLFLVTDFFGAQANADTEIQQGKNAIDAAKEAGVKMVVFSSLESLPEDVKEKLPRLKDGRTISHFESKATIAEYLKQSGLDWTVLLTSIFYENLVTTKFSMYQKQPDGSYVFASNLGTGPHAWHAVGDIGLTVAEVVNDPAKFNGKTVIVVREHIAYPEIANAISSVTGKTVKYQTITDEQFASLPSPVAHEISNMYSYFRQFPYFDDMRPPDKRVVDGPTFKEWAEANRDQLLKKLEAS